MKKFIWGIVGIPIAIALCYFISCVAEVSFLLVTIDNAEFGFPLWLDIIVDVVAGVITYIFAFLLCGLSNKDKKVAEQIISIIVGFAVSIITHCLLKYWYVIAGILVVIIAVSTVICVKGKKKESES